MSDETPTHRRVMEKARAEIERLALALHQTTQERDAEADAVTAQREEIKRLTRELAVVTAQRDTALDIASEGAWAARALDAERDNAALRAVMPNPLTVKRVIECLRGNWCDAEDAVELSDALLRLSPPSAPAQDGAERCPEFDCVDGTYIHENGMKGKCGTCHGTGKARR